MPANPIYNPFAVDYLRCLFRSLQYARSCIEIQDLNFTSREVIRNTGLHLEMAMKYLSKRKFSFNYDLNNCKKTLGGLKNSLYRKNKINDDQFECLGFITELYNMSKHNINMDIERDMSFSSSDAIVFYVVSRKLSIELLVQCSQ